MNTLHLFGDSFTEGHKLDNSFPWYKVWKEWRGGNLPPVWHELLSEKLGMETNVKAIGGSSNHETFHTICENSDLFKKADAIKYLKKIYYYFDKEIYSRTKNKPLITNLEIKKNSHYIKNFEIKFFILIIFLLLSFFSLALLTIMLIKILSINKK